MNTEATIETQSTEPVESPPVLIDLGLIAPEDSGEHSFASKYRAQAAIKISDIKQDGRYQFRVATNKENVARMAGLINDGIKFHTPIRLLAGSWASLDILDGHHRVKAYEGLGYTEIPIDQIEIVETRSYAAQHIMPMKANTSHGLTNTIPDFYKMLSFIAEKKHPREFMKNDFELDIPTIALNIGTTKTLLEYVHNKFKGPKDAPHPTLSQQLKAKRDEAIIEAYTEEEMSANAIAKKFNIKSHKTVLKVIEDWEARIAESEKRQEEELAERKRRSAVVAAQWGYSKDALLSWDEIHEKEALLGLGDGSYEDTKPSAPPLELPMADTSDRSATRGDMGEILAKHMAKVDRLEEGRIVEEDGRLVEDFSGPLPTDAEIKASQAEIMKLMQGWGEPGTNAKAVKISDMDAEQLQAAWKQNQVVKKRADRKHDELLAAAANLGISLEG